MENKNKNKQKNTKLEANKQTKETNILHWKPFYYPFTDRVFAM